MQGMKMDMQEDIRMQTLIGDSAMVNFGEKIWFYILDEDMVIDQINETFNPYTYDLTESDFSIVTPDTYGIYSESWRNERAIRYSSYEKSDTEDNSDMENTAKNSEKDDDDEVVYYHDD